MLQSKGSRYEGGGKRQEQGVGSMEGKGKVCFGFLLLDDPCPSDYALGQRNPSGSQEASVSDCLPFSGTSGMVFQSS